MHISSFHGNWIDLVIIILLFFYLYSGARRGFILGVLDLGGFIVSFFAALKLYSFFGAVFIDNFSLPKGIANALGFVVAGILAEFIFSIIVNLFFLRILKKVIRVLSSDRSPFMPQVLERILGLLPAIGEALIFIAFVLTLLITLPIKGSLKNDIISSKLGGPLVSRTQKLERQLNLIFGEAVYETLTFLTINPNPLSNESVDLRFTQLDVKVERTSEMTMLTLINKERRKRGLHGLSLSLQLQDLARTYAKDMFARGYFSHNNPEGASPFDRMERVGISFRVAGENLALAPNVFLAHQGLMSSKGHRANILNKDFKRIGIGVIDGGIYGRIFVQEFTD